MHVSNLSTKRTGINKIVHSEVAVGAETIFTGQAAGRACDRNLLEDLVFISPLVILVSIPM
jgi:hypothetical protein